LLLPRLHAFFSPVLIADAEHVAVEDGYFSYDGVPLKWHLPLGLLHDIYVMSVRDASSDQSPSPADLPFKLTLHFLHNDASNAVNLINPDPITMHDSFINSVKEADFLRSGNARPIMTLPAADSKALWSSTQENDLATFSKIFQALLPPAGRMTNIPIKIYLPSSSSEEDPTVAQMKVLQAHVSPTISTPIPTTAAQARAATTNQSQTLGTALHSLIPSLFPSRRTPILARPVLHGAEVPLNSNLEELARWAGYADGWLSVVVSIET
jgi:autophagy-related protein 5